MTDPSGDFIKAMASEQRRRLVGMLMDHFERQVLPLIPAAQRVTVKEAYRAKLMDAVGRYHDYTLDALKAAAASSGNIVNEHYLRLIDDIHRAVT